MASFIGPKRFRPPALTVDHLPDDLDAVLISHNHFDHLDYQSVKELNKRYGERLSWFCGIGLRQWFLDIGIQNVVELDWWEEYYFSVNRVYICVDLCCLLFLEKGCEHFILSSSTLVLFHNVCVGKKGSFSFRSRRTAFDRNKSLWGGYAVWDATHRFYFAGDTGYTHNISIFRQIGEKYGPFDLSTIPIGTYEPKWIMQAQHVSPEEAVQIHIDVQSKKSIGIHWGTWALANEYFLEPPKKLSEAVKAHGLDPSSFTVLKHGEVLDLS